MTAVEHWAAGPGTTDLDREVLDLMEQVGIQVDTCDPHPGSNWVPNYVAHRDRHGNLEHDSLIVWFMDETSFLALQDLQYRADVEEFGCDWSYIYPTGLRAEFIRGTFAAAIPRRDLPVLIDLLRRELAGEFQPTPAQLARRRRARWERFVPLACAFVTWLEVPYQWLTRHAPSLGFPIFATVVYAVAFGWFDHRAGSGPEQRAAPDICRERRAES